MYTSYRVESRNESQNSARKSGTPSSGSKLSNSTARSTDPANGKSPSSGSASADNQTSATIKPQINTNTKYVAKVEDIIASDPEVKKAVDEAWELIERQCANEDMRRKERIKGSKTGEISQGGWKTIRVFVSSTFTDMHSEREILIKKVFPALREWCEERKFTLIDCDLRWGVPKDSTTRTTICTCLEELDRCYEDNEELPFFVSMLSDRYGWVPTDAEVPDDVKQKYDWVPQVSITHMEILHGAYRFKNPNAIFCFRNPAYVKDLPAEQLSRFVDKQGHNQHHLAVLKAKVADKFDTQVLEYHCNVAGIDMSTGREKVNIVGLESFADQILSFLREAIDRQYPDHHLSPELTPAQQEDNAHWAAMKTKAEFVVGREHELKILMDYVKTGLDPSGTLRLREKPKNDEENEKRKTELEEECTKFKVLYTDSRIVCAVGESGFGKSALLAKLAEEASKEGLNVLYHQVGCTVQSQTSDMIQKRIIKYMKDSAAEKNKDSKEDGEEEQEEEDGEEEEGKLAVQFEKTLTDARESGKQLLIILDALDEMSDNNSSNFLAWLPPRFPGNMKCVVSSRVNHWPCMARVESRDSYFLDVAAMTNEGAADMVNYYLNKFNKKLDAVQLSTLLSHTSACTPFWMSVACEELRVFGDFATVSEKIKNFPDDLTEMLKAVFQRLLREDETENMDNVLSMMCCSLSGIPESEVTHLLGDPVNKKDVPFVVWATVRRYLKPFVRTMIDNDARTARVTMAHQLSSQAADALVLSDKVKRTKMHTFLADYYEKYCGNKSYLVKDLPHHLFESGLWERMIQFYRQDRRAMDIHEFSRSQTLSKIRCQEFIHKNMTMIIAPMFICMMCKFRNNILQQSSHPTKDLCAVCGNWVPFKNENSHAFLCRKHKPTGVAPGWGKCFACQRIFLENQFEKLYMCTYCSGGRGGMICCQLQSTRP